MSLRQLALKSKARSSTSASPSPGVVYPPPPLVVLDTRGRGDGCLPSQIIRPEYSCPCGHCSGIQGKTEMSDIMTPLLAIVCRARASGKCGNCFLRASPSSRPADGGRAGFANQASSYSGQGENMEKYIESPLSN